MNTIFRNPYQVFPGDQQEVPLSEVVRQLRDCETVLAHGPAIRAVLAELDNRESRILVLRAGIETVIRHGVAHSVDLRKLLAADLERVAD
jgi:hypothetical protein